MEGLAYLTFDADVKEEFVEDEAALKALFQLSKVALRVPVVSQPRGRTWDESLPGVSGDAGPASCFVWPWCLQCLGAQLPRRS